ncbi:MAG: hypothetical protein JNG85_13195 [Spirochaetaceae bacterium]|nr:hypothetical protein [Spirochaetaceae bacterium]
MKPVSLRNQLEQIEKQTGRRDPLLDSVKVPEGFEYLWREFWTIRAGAGEGFGGTRVTWRDLADYQAVTGVRFDAFEVEAIMAMDQATSGDVAKE